MTSKRSRNTKKAKVKAAQKKAKVKVELPPFDKDFYYHSSVQNPESDIEYLTSAYKELRGKEALVFDFLATVALLAVGVIDHCGAISFLADFSQATALSARERPNV